MRATMRRDAPRAGPAGWQPGATIVRRAAIEPASYDAATRTIEAVLSTGARVRRWGIFEEIDLAPEAVGLDRIGQGAVRLLDSHNAYDLDAVLGTVVSARLEGGALVGTIRFAESERAREIEARVARGELGSVSIGYRVDQWTIQTAPAAAEPEVWRATRWELLEVSLVAVPADPGAAVRSATPSTHEDDAMTRATAAATEVAEETRSAPPAPPAQAASPDATAIAERARAEERTRVATLTEIARQASLEGGALDAAIRDGIAVEDFRRRAFDTLVARQSGSETSSTVVTRDEGDARRAAMVEAMAIQLGAVERSGASVVRATPSDAARPYMDHRLYELAAEAIGHRDVPRTVAQREAVLTRAFHTTSDFPVLLENAMNRTLQSRYEVLAPTYRALARQRTYVDFRAHQAVRTGDFPNLQPVLETGEIRSGSIADAVKEQTSVKSYGVVVGVSRQLLVNDTLGGLAQSLADYSTKVAQFEDETFYAMMLSASGAGPTLLEDSTALFHANHGNLAGAGSVIDETSVDAARRAIRGQKRRDGTVIDVSPTILLVGPARLVAARRVVAATTPATTAGFNPFSGEFRIIETSRITGNAWYMFVEPSQLPCFEWGLLDGYAAPRMRIEEPFGMQGVKIELAHDFGCGAIDWRGAYRNPGA